jgi:hypothetical protein
MPPGGNGKEKRCECASPRFDLSCGNRLKYALDLCDTVLPDQPLPVPQGPVVDELDDNGFFVLGRFKFLKPVRPKERPKTLRQLRVLSFGSRVHGHKSCDYIWLKYTKPECFGNVFLPPESVRSLRHSPASAITTPTAHPATSAVGKTARRRIKGTCSAALGKEPCRALLRFAAYGLYRPDVEERTGRDECGIFFDHSLVGWAVPSPPGGAEGATWGQRGSTHFISHLIIHRRVADPFYFYVAPSRPHWQQ